jgi:hypothetical protein
MAELNDTLIEQSLGRVAAEDACDMEPGGGNLLQVMEHINCTALQFDMDASASPSRIDGMQGDALEEYGGGRMEMESAAAFDIEVQSDKLNANPLDQSMTYEAFTMHEHEEAAAEGKRLHPSMYHADQRLCSNTKDATYHRKVCPTFGNKNDRVRIVSRDWQTMYSPQGDAASAPAPCRSTHARP